MPYRTRTYIAGDWTGDADAIQQLYKWNDSDHLNLSFTDAHELTQARDNSLYCSVKRSLKERLDCSKTFVLIVGANTLQLTKGSCSYCASYNSYGHYCARGYSKDFKSYIEYECEQAVNAGMKIVVLYNYSAVKREKCPEVLRYKGSHINMYYYANDGKCYWNYLEIKKAIVGY